MSQIIASWLSLPFWLALAAMAWRVVTGPDDVTGSSLAWLGVQVFVVVAAVALGMAMVRLAA